MRSMAVHWKQLSRRACTLAVAAGCASLAAQQVQSAATPVDLVIKDATVMTATRGTLAHGSVWVHAGKIAAVGESVSAPAGAAIVDARGKYLTPGIIDPHSHSALDNDVNEATSPVTPSMMMIDAFDNTDKALYQALAGGVTTELLLHGSANLIGGQAVVIKNKFGLSREAMLFPNAPRSIKFASGENPKRVYGSRHELPSTRMGNFEVMRQSFEDAKVYMATWDAYNAKVAKGEKDAVAPRKDLKLEALSDVLRGKLFVQIHCYRADEFLTEEALAKEYGYKIRAFHHALEMYKVGDRIAPTGTAIATFADWWGYKDEAWDAIPWNAMMSKREGIRVALKSDSNDYVRRFEPGSRKDDPLRWRHRGRGAADGHHQSGMDHRGGRSSRFHRERKGRRPRPVGQGSPFDLCSRGEGLHRRRSVLRQLAPGLRHPRTSLA